MGYTTTFDGSFNLNKPLAEAHKNYLLKFADTRRMKRLEELTIDRDDPIRHAAELPVGYDGAYFVGELGVCGQGLNYRAGSIPDLVDYNTPPSGQPSLWCQWIPTRDGTSIKWDGNEKFYNYIQWIEYIIENFLKPWGYVLNGEVQWFGENPDDRGIICVDNNIVGIKVARITFEKV